MVILLVVIIFSNCIVTQFDVRSFFWRCGSAVDPRLMEYCDPRYNRLSEYVYVGCGRQVRSSLYRPWVRQ